MRPNDHMSTYKVAELEAIASRHHQRLKDKGTFSIPIDIEAIIEEEGIQIDVKRGLQDLGICGMIGTDLDTGKILIDQRQLFFPTALTQDFCYRSPVVASVKCYQKLEAYDGQENQFADEKGIAGGIATTVS